jgi:hypothetical protein
LPQHYSPADPRDNPVWRIRTVLERAGCEPWYSEFRGCWLARCPCNPDHRLSLYRGADGRAELECFDECDPDAILRALRLSFFDLCPRYVRPATEAA